MSTRQDVESKTDPAALSENTKRQPFSWQKSWPYFLIIPAIVLELIVHIIPMAVGIYMSTKEISVRNIVRFWELPIVFPDNYVEVLDQSTVMGQEFRTALVHSIVYAVLVTAACWFLGFWAGVFLHRKFRGRAFLRTLFLVPYALPAFAGIIVWRFMLQSDNGMVNDVLVNVTGVLDESPFWLIGDASFWSMTVVRIWIMWPFAFFMMLAAMQSVSDDLYQAAEIDGASPWQQVRRITFPLLLPVSFVVCLVIFLWTFNDFTTPFVLFGKNSPEEAELVPSYLYRASFAQFRFGEGAAASTLLLVAMVAIAVLTTSLRRRSRGHA